MSSFSITPCLHLNPVPAYPPRAALLTYTDPSMTSLAEEEGWTTSGQDGTQFCMLASSRTGYIAQVCWLPAHSVSFIHQGSMQTPLLWNWFKTNLAPYSNLLYRHTVILLCVSILVS